MAICAVNLNITDLTGELEDRQFIVTRGDSRISMQIARNQHTVAFDRERRFLIDDPETPHKLAYLLTKPLKRGLTYNSQGIFKFVLQEVTATEDDNHELGIADYYKHFTKNSDTQPSDPTTPSSPSTPSSGSDSSSTGGKKVWI